MRYLILTILILNLAACCKRDYECVISESLSIFITYDESSVSGFTKEEIANRYILVFNNESQKVVDTIRTQGFDDEIVIDEELWMNREMKNHSYIIRIGNLSKDIDNIEYQFDESVRTCKEPYFPYEIKEFNFQEYGSLIFEYQGKRTDKTWIEVKR